LDIGFGSGSCFALGLRSRRDPTDSIHVGIRQYGVVSCTNFLNCYSHSNYHQELICPSLEHNFSLDTDFTKKTNLFAKLYLFMMKQALLFSEDDGILYLCNKLKMGRGNMGVKGGRPGQIPKGGEGKIS